MPVSGSRPLRRRGPSPRPTSSSAGALAVAVAALLAFLGRWAAARLAARGISPAILLPGRVVAGMVGVDGLGWSATGLGVWLLAGARGVEVDARLLLCAYALS